MRATLEIANTDDAILSLDYCIDDSGLYFTSTLSLKDFKYEGETNAVGSAL